MTLLVLFIAAAVTAAAVARSCGATGGSPAAPSEGTAAGRRGDPAPPGPSTAATARSEIATGLGLTLRSR